MSYATKKNMVLLKKILNVFWSHFSMLAMVAVHFDAPDKFLSFLAYDLMSETAF